MCSACAWVEPAALRVRLFARRQAGGDVISLGRDDHEHFANSGRLAARARIAQDTDLPAAVSRRVSF
jgi:hypothetical protein